MNELPVGFALSGKPLATIRPLGQCLSQKREFIMRRFSIVAGIGLVAMCFWAFGGCGKGEPAAPEGAETAESHEHDHADEGPHGGHIIELGNEDYHAELTHDDDAHRVGVYFLGDDAKTAKPIDAESVTINVAVDGKPSSYTLPAAPQEGEAEGKSSYFELVSEPLNIVVSGKSESPRTNARLNVTIEGKPYVGLVETEAHDHDHAH
jgi:hypothetical protein